jgi:DNA-binding response OmpR family regulator
MKEMDRLLKVLILEDSRDDVDLIERELKRGNINFTSVVVNKKVEFEKALTEFQPDIVLSDHSMPLFNSIEALKLCKDYQKDQNVCVPFILVTGAVSEEFAVLCIKAGADDYILKDRLKRLPASIEGALEKARVENERQRYLQELISNEALMKETEHLAKLGSWQADLLTGKVRWSDEAFRLYGYRPGEVEPGYENFLAIVHPEDVGSLRAQLDKLVQTGDSFQGQFRIIDKQNNIKYIDSKVVVQRDAAGQATCVTGFNLDITDFRKQTIAIENQNNVLKAIAWMQSHEVRGPLARMMGLISLINQYKDSEHNINELLNNILDSAHELDTIVRNIVRKTEQIDSKEYHS